MDQFNKQPCLDYHMQSQQFMHDSDSLEDFSGTIIVDRIVQPKREMYGQQPVDMKVTNINWMEWPNVARLTSVANPDNTAGVV
uniref:Uncharacterized protein n=1 Tax=Globodera rostochiensis TaxID=31243 RepID=A0A914H497_GLORO